MQRRPFSSRALGLALGVLADVAFGDPRRGHPVAVFGSAAARLERWWWADRRGPGVAYAGVLVGGAVAGGVLAERLVARHAVVRAVLTAAATWAVLGGTSLAGEGAAMAASLEAGDLAAGRARLPHLCGRDPSSLDADGLARAALESVAENTADAVVAPLVWGAVAGVPGLLGHRAVNTLDAMVGHRSPRYLQFGWAAARLDDLVNWVPARVSGAAAAGWAPMVGGSRELALRAVADGAGRHPSPNAGVVEAAFAGALDVRLGGRNIYDGQAEDRGELGTGRAAEIADITRANRLAAAVSITGLLVAVLVRMVRR